MSNRKQGFIRLVTTETEGDIRISRRGNQMQEGRNFKASYLVKSRREPDDISAVSEYKSKITIELYFDVDNPLQASKLYMMGKQISQLLSQDLNGNGECRVLSFLVK